MSIPSFDAADVDDRLRRLYLAVFFGGMVGAAARLGLTAALPSGTIVWGVLVANLFGALALGILFEAMREHRLGGTSRWAFWGPGALGAFTTFSALQMEAADLMRGGDLWRGVLYLVASIALGVPLAALGRWLVVRVR